MTTQIVDAAINRSWFLGTDLHLLSRRPVRLWNTCSTGVDQTRPSPDSLPLRAASTIAATASSTIASETTNVSSAFGRKRDSKTRPRYSCVTPRSRPCPIASITVTPTWPVASSTASITVSTRSRSTMASTFTMRSPPRLPTKKRPRAHTEGVPEASMPLRAGVSAGLGRSDTTQTEGWVAVGAGSRSRLQDALHVREDVFPSGHCLRATGLAGHTRPHRLGSISRTGATHQMSAFGLRCRVCEDRLASGAVDACRRCDGPERHDLRLGPDRARRVARLRRRRPGSLWRYEALLPAGARVEYGAGWTPLRPRRPPLRAARASTCT